MSRRYTESALLSHAIASGSMGFLLQDQIHPSYFQHYYEESKALYKKFEKDGVIPSHSRVQKKFPDLPYDPPEERDLEDMKGELKQYHAKSIVQKALYEAQPLWSTDDWEKGLDQIREAADEADAVKSNHKIMDLTEHATDRYNYFQERSKGEEGEAWKLALAHPYMNEYLGGLEPGDLFVYAARPNIGKSFAALSDAVNIWRKYVTVLFVSLEMNTNKIGFRFDSEYGHWSSFNLSRGLAINIIDGSPLDRGRFATAESADEYMEYIKEMESKKKSGELPPFYVITPANAGRTITPSYINSQAKRLGAGLVVVDYMGLVRSDSGDTNEISRLDEVSWGFKESAERLGIPYIVPHQLNREAEKAKEVTVANFAGSDSIGRNIDTAAHIQAEDGYVYYNLLKVRGGPSNAQFGWYWDYDNAVRKPIDVTQMVLPDGSGEGDLGNNIPNEDEDYDEDAF